MQSYDISFVNGCTQSLTRVVFAQFIVTNADANVPLIFYECDGLEQGRGIEI